MDLPDGGRTVSIDHAAREDLVFLGGDAVDRLSRVCLELAAELWVTRERLAVVERQLLSGEPFADPDTVDVTDLRRVRPADRDAFIERVLGPLVSP